VLGGYRARSWLRFDTRQHAAAQPSTNRLLDRVDAEISSQSELIDYRRDVMVA